VATLPMWWQHGLPEEDGIYHQAGEGATNVPHPLPLGEGRGEGCLWQGMYYILNSCQPFYHKGPVAKWLVKFLEQMVAAGQISACRLMPFG